MRVRRKWAMPPALVGVAVALMLAAIIVPGITARSQGTFRVRVLNAVPDSAGVDVWIDDAQLANNGAYKTVTTYKDREEGNYALSIFQPGKTTQSGAYVYKEGFFFRAPKDYTIIVMGRQSDNSVTFSVEIDRNTLDSASARIRLGNYLPGTGALTLATGGTNTVLGNARYGETDEYASLAAGTYTLTLNTGSTLITKQENVTLAANTVTTVFAVGINGGTPAPAFVITTDAGTAPAQTAATPTASATTAPPTPIPPTPTPTSAASAALRQSLAPVPSSAATNGRVFYAATGHTLGGPFKAYWEANGGLARFGYPVTEEYSDVSLTDGKTYTTQWFERARFEYHPENKGTQYEVLTGLLGTEMLKMMGVK